MLQKKKKATIEEEISLQRVEIGMWTNFYRYRRGVLTAVAALDVACQMHLPYDCGRLVVKRNTLEMSLLQMSCTQNDFHSCLVRRARGGPFGWLTRIFLSCGPCPSDAARSS